MGGLGFFLGRSVLFFAFELVWIGQILRRLPKDLESFRRPWNKLDRYVYIILWLITALFVLHLAWAARSLIGTLSKLF